jgi:hypothetical protein
MQTLLLEKGGVTGDSDDAEVSRHQADLTPGLIFPVRLETRVSSHQSRAGDPIRAVVTAPVRQGSRVVLRPGTKIEGTVMLAEHARSKYEQARLVLDLASVVHDDGSRSRLYSRVLGVDNARESVSNNEVHGIVEPHASKKQSITMVAVGIADPLLGLGIFAARKGHGLAMRREIVYPEGTDVMVQIIRPSMLKTEAWPGWPELEGGTELERIVQKAPLRTAAKSGEPSDLTNVMLIGSRQELEAAFAAAGWKTADELSMRTAFKELKAAALDSGYDHAPLSLLTLNGAPPDIVFQKTLNTISKRHHVRIWKQEGVLYDGRETWVAAATHDIGVGVGSKGTKWYHRIDPWVDREREKVQNDLLFARGATGYTVIDRQAAPTRSSNATGDEIITDGKMLVLALASREPAGAATAGGSILTAGVLLMVPLDALDEPRAYKDFDERVERYWDLRNDIDEDIPSLKTDEPSADTIVSREHALAEGIQAARANAAEGDIFTRDISAMLTGVFERQLSPDARERILGEGNPAHPESAADVDLRVNAKYPTEAPTSTMPTSILLVLPRLPEGLEYRFVGRNLILYDSEAGLIVDVLRNAIR